MSSVRLPQSLGTSVAVDDTGDAYVAGFIASSSDDENDDQIVVHKVWHANYSHTWNETRRL